MLRNYSFSQSQIRRESFFYYYYESTLYCTYCTRICSSLSQCPPEWNDTEDYLETDLIRTTFSQ